MKIDSQRLASALTTARKALLEARNQSGHWIGELSSSALSTATAVTALAIVQREATTVAQSAIRDFKSEIENGLAWLANNQNTDGGWGDTTRSLSNISTTALCWAAFGAVSGADERRRAVVQRAEAWLALHSQNLLPANPPAPSEGERAGVRRTQPKPHAGSSASTTLPLNLESLITAIIARYGKDRTFSVPILTMCALAGRLGQGAQAWERVLPLPFELAAFPHQFFAALRLPVVSYALPALIAIGQARHHHLPSGNPFACFIRNKTRERTLKVLGSIQPTSGGFLEATPLTSFVTMSLAGSGQVNHPVVKKGVEFLLASVRTDGSWPIDTNLATWVTTLAVNAIYDSRLTNCDLETASPEQSQIANRKSQIRDWLLGQQYRVEHPYTHAPPGGWAWTDLPGGVPDADDTAGALIALKNLSLAPGFSRVSEKAGEKKLLKQFFTDDGAANTRLKPGANEADVHRHASTFINSEIHTAARTGLGWLLNLQNRDGGIPTFCRGWTNLPFDRSSPDLTAHAIRAWTAWRPDFPLVDEVLRDAIGRAVRYLAETRQPGRGWVPLWFGNQHAPDEENPVYGTAKVLLALTELSSEEFPEVELLLAGAVMPLVDMQHADGSWGGAGDGPASVEETALAVEALAGLLVNPKLNGSLLAKHARNAVFKGTQWLVEQVESGAWAHAAPIGFYFAKLWYYEKLYPLIFTAGALSRVAKVFTQIAPPAENDPSLG